MRTLFFIFTLMFLLSAPAFAQYDSRGCSAIAPTTADPSTLESSLWTFRSNVWDGYIDFQDGGKYWTYWGAGTWTVNPNGTIHMANDYNQYTYEIALIDNGFRFHGSRIDGLEISGSLICAKYQGAASIISPELKEAFINMFHHLYDRDPSHQELVRMTKQYNAHVPLSTIKETLKQTPEYLQKHPPEPPPVDKAQPGELIQ
jgi:hypothetical protein